MKKLDFIKVITATFLCLFMLNQQGTAQNNIDDLCETCEILKQNEKHAAYKLMGCVELESSCLKVNKSGGTGPIVMGGSRNEQHSQNNNNNVLKIGKTRTLMLPLRHNRNNNKRIKLEVEVQAKGNKTVFSSKGKSFEVCYLTKTGHKKVRTSKNTQVVQFTKNDAKCYAFIPITIRREMQSSNGKISVKLYVYDKRSKKWVLGDVITKDIQIKGNHKKKNLPIKGNKKKKYNPKNKLKKTKINN